jgi:flagella synthesis protein FlgN
MTRKEVLACLMRDVALDLDGYRELSVLLDDQFHAALRYETAKLGEVAARIATLVDALESRRAQRVALVSGLLGKGATMAGVLPLLNGAVRDALESGWKSLESLVQESKQRNERNCKLLMDQHGIMQRVLHGEEQIYAPA